MSPSTISRSSGSAMASRRGHGLRLPGRDLVHVAGHHVGSCHRLVRGRDVPVGVAGRLVDLEATPGVPQRRFRPAEDRVDPRALPLAARQVDRLAVRHLAPVVARGVGAVDHLVVLLRCAVGALEQRPGVVEQVGGELAARRRVELGRFGAGGRCGHGGRVLRAELAEDVQDALEPERACLDPVRGARAGAGADRPGRRSRAARGSSRAVPRGRAAGRSSAPSRAGRAGRAGSS